MAARRFYAYYVRGSQLALVEHDNVSGSGQTLGQPSLDDIGPSGALSWKSPVATVADGLEIEYAYSPRYILGAGDVLGDTKVVVGSWFIDSDGYLNFNTHSYALAGGVISASASPYDNFTIENYFLVTKSKYWNGIHKSKTLFSNGFIQTYTKPSNKYGTGVIGSGSPMKSHSDGYIHGNDDGEVWVNLSLSTGDFVNLYDMSDSADNGLYKVTSITEVDGGAESAQKAYLGTKYFLNQEDDIDEWQTGDSHLTTDTSMSVTKVIYDPCYLHANVSALNDEFDTIDLPEYLSKALVYYVKSKLAEDAMDLEQKEYYIREFHRIVEKHESSKVWGPRIMVPGSHGIR